MRRKESFNKASEEGWIYCEICDYQCKKKNTIRKHMKTNHRHCKACTFCGNLFASEGSLAAHEEKDHGEEEGEMNTSFVFSDSMLDKYLQYAKETKKGVIRLDKAL